MMFVSTRTELPADIKPVCIRTVERDAQKPEETITVKMNSN